MVSEPADGIGVLFLCTGNSARSVLAEAALVRRGGARFRSYSAGSHPKTVPHPITLETLARLGYPTEGLRSKSWDEFAAPGAPRVDLVVTVCDDAKGETCPVWPGGPLTAHWGVEDPAAFEGPEAAKRAFFERIHDELAARIDALVRLDWASRDEAALTAEIRALAGPRPSSQEP